MELDKFKEFLESRGWNKSTNQDGESDWCYSNDGLIIQLYDGFYKSKDGELIELSCSLSNPDFLNAAKIISQDNQNGYPIKITHIELPWGNSWIPFTECENRILEWASNFDLDAELDRFEALPTSAPGAGPIKHLSALAIRHRSSQIEEYINSFRDGRRLGFVNYIDIGYLNRAHELAKG